MSNIVIYTFSDIKDEVLDYIDSNRVRAILCIDKKEYLKANDHKIYLYPNSKKETIDIRKNLRFKIMIEYLNDHNIWTRNIKGQMGLIKTLNREQNFNFYNENKDKIDDVKKLLKNSSLYDNLIYAVETADFTDLWKFKSSHQQYNHPLIKAEKGDIIVDGGSYDFKSSYIFLARTKFKSFCHCFETNIWNMDFDYIERKKIGDYIQINNKALWDKKETLKFTNKKYASTIDNNGDVSCVSEVLDEYFSSSEPPSLIKLDIEGAEINALNGAKDLIREYKPKLQIAIYHKPNHFFEIPLLIKELNNNYSEFYVGYHSYYSWLDRTILYVK